MISDPALKILYNCNCLYTYVHDQLRTGSLSHKSCGAADRGAREFDKCAVMITGVAGFALRSQPEGCSAIFQRSSCGLRSGKLVALPCRQASRRTDRPDRRADWPAHWLAEKEKETDSERGRKSKNERETDGEHDRAC